MEDDDILPHEAIFDILLRSPLKSVCRFRCVSKRWRDLISVPIFVLAHRFHHPEPHLVDTGSFQKEESDGGRDIRLMDMDGNVVRVIKRAGGYGMACNTSLDSLVCVNGASCGGINGVLYFLTDKNSLLCFDLESEHWKVGMVQGPPSAVCENTSTMQVRITELNGALCAVQPQFVEHNTMFQPPAYSRITNIWILNDSDQSIWIKEYTIPMAPSACRYMPLWVMRDEKLLLHCSLDKGRSLVLQTYDPKTGTFANVTDAPRDLAGRIGLCNMHLGHFVSTKNQLSVLSVFVDVVLLFSE